MPERGKYDRALSAAARKKAQRRALVVAATAVFSVKSYADASVEDVVREAGVSRRTFYEQFDDLRAALAAVHDASGKFAMARVESEMAQEEVPARRLERGIRALLSLIAENGGLARVLFGNAAAGPRFEERQERLRAHFAEVVRTTLADAHRRGELPRAPDGISVLAVVAGIEAVGARMAQPGGPALDDATAAMARLARGACR